MATQPLAAGIACEPFPVGSRSLASVHSKPPGLTTSETLHPVYARHSYKRPVRSVGGISLSSTYYSKVSPIAIRSSPWFDSIPSRHAKLLVQNAFCLTLTAICLFRELNEMCDVHVENSSPPSEGAASFPSVQDLLA